MNEEPKIVVKKSKRNIFGFLLPPHPCPMCDDVTDVFERIVTPTGNVFVCPTCMDWLLEEIQRRAEEQEETND
jgi:hypothetical protein